MYLSLLLYIVSLLSPSQQVPPLDLKGPSYYIGQGTDKLFNEGVLTIYNELDAIKQNLRELLKPNGTRSNPARSCYDLFLCNPDFLEGQYWIDPNLGSVDDAIPVHCVRPGCSCVECSDRSKSDIVNNNKMMQVSE